MEEFERIKKLYEKSNKYILYTSYEDVGILLHIIDIMIKRNKQNENQKEYIIKYLRQYKEILIKKSLDEKNIYV